MYIDNNDVRTPRERVDGELLRQIRQTDKNYRTRGGIAPVPQGVKRKFSPNGADFASREKACAVDGAERGNCGTANGGWGLNDHPLAMVYSPLNVWRNAYDPEMGLSRGTIFAELDMPFGDNAPKGRML